MSINVAAVDLGASSGRVMLGRVGRDELRLEAVARFGNDPVRLPDGLHWNVLELHRQALLGLRAAVTAAGRHGLASIGVDSWAVDYGLTREGSLLGQPFHYRDDRCAAGVAAVHAVVGAEELYRRNGLQHLPFNTLFQLAADRLLPLADGALLVPDLLTWWLTGQRVTERTNASTTGLLDVRTQDWDTELAATLGLPPGLFGELVDPGTVVGALGPDVAAAVGASVPVCTVGSHDTASAVVGVPLTDADAAYVSVGTWGLVGVELDKPVVTPESRAANFTNEGGVDGRVRFLTNVMGTWLLSETLRTWERSGEPADLVTLLREAADHHADHPGEGTVFDVQDARFLPPGDMPARIAAWCAEHDRPAPHGQAATVLSIVRSLVEGFATALEQAGSLSGVDVRRVHVVGGGAQNTLLCQLLADRVGRPVVAGPVEATALGNVLVQARAAGALSGTLEDLRALVALTQDLREFRPRRNPTSPA